MASNYFFKNTTASEPVANAMVDSTPNENSYTSAKDMTLTANSGGAATLSRGYGLGADAVLHYLRLTNFFTPALANQTIGSQTWTVKIWVSMNILPVFATPYYYAYLYIWDGVNDTIRTTIGSVATVAITATALTAYTMTFTGGAALTLNDRIGVDIYPVVDDDPGDILTGVLTMTLRYAGLTVSVDRDSGLSSPATLVEAVAGAPSLMTLGAGI